MGIAIPRPAIRAKESRAVTNVLARHASLTRLMESDGVPTEDASQIAFILVRTTKQRKQIWRAR